MPRKVRTRKYGKSRVNKRKHRRSLKKKMNKRSTKKTRQYRKNRTRRRLGGNYSNLKEFEENAKLGEFFHVNADRQLERISYIKLNGNKILKYYDEPSSFYLEGGSIQDAYVLISDNLTWNEGIWNQKEFEEDNKDLISALQTLPDEQQKSILDEILNHDERKIEATMATLEKNKKGSVLGKHGKYEDNTSSKKARKMEQVPKTHEYWNDEWEGGFNPQQALQDPKHNIGDTIIINHDNQEGKNTYKVTEQALVDTDTGKIPGMGYYRQAKP